MEQNEAGLYKVHVKVEEPNGEERAYNARSLIVMSVTKDENGEWIAVGNMIFDAENLLDKLALYVLMQDISERLCHDFPNLEKMYMLLKQEGTGVECEEVKS